jgi:FG-GAP repeat
MFTKSDSSWTHASVQVLNGSDAHNDDLTGSAVAIDSDVVVAGAPKLGKYVGAAFVFVKH